MDNVDKNRVPEIILLYWVIKIASTTLGETGADMVSMTFKLGYATTIVIFLALFLALLAWKLMVRGYHPALYWSVFTASAIAGTGISDFLDRTLGLGYALGSAILVGALLLILLAWYWRGEVHQRGAHRHGPGRALLLAGIPHREHLGHCGGRLPGR